MKFLVSLVGAIGVTSASMAQFVEGPDFGASKGAAGNFTVADGTFIDGAVSASTDVDYMRLNLPSQTAGIYRNQITTSRRAGSSQTAVTRLRGLTAVNGTTVDAGTDTITQFSSSVGANVDSLNQFFSFGNATSVYLTASGSSARNYRTTFTQTLVTPTTIAGTFAPGSYTFDGNGVDTDGTNTATVDTEFVLYDSNFQIVGKNDNRATDQAAFFTANLNAGTYFFAVSDWDLTHHEANSANDGILSGVDAMDFAGVLVNSSIFFDGFNQPTLDTSFALSGPGGTTQVNGIKTERFGVNWYTFTVAEPVPEPATMIALGLGVFGLAKRRRATN